MIKETLLASAFGLLGLVTVACGSQKKDQMVEAVSETASETAWCLDGFVRPAGVNPVIKPLPTKFYCPMREDSVAWEESDTFNPAATIYDGKITPLKESVPGLPVWDMRPLLTVSISRGIRSLLFIRLKIIKRRTNVPEVRKILVSL